VQEAAISAKDQRFDETERDRRIVVDARHDFEAPAASACVGAGTKSTWAC
jgi:hypothetical protein